MLAAVFVGSSDSPKQDIRSGKYQVVIISPEMILSKVFLTQIIRNTEMARRILAIVVDEAHVVSFWGTDFRKKYGTLGILRALLPRSTPFVAMSATLAPRVRADVLNKLQYNQNNFVDINLGNERENVSIVVRSMHHAMNTYRDLDFLIPPDLRSSKDIKKAFVYADTLAVATDIEDHLYELCPERLRYTGFIRPYSAAFSTKYREEVMKQFREGTVRVLICTDAAGMVSISVWCILNSNNALTLDRDVIYQISTSWCSGSSLHQSRHLCSVQDALREALTVWVLRFFWLKGQCTMLISSHTWSQQKGRKSARIPRKVVRPTFEHPQTIRGLGTLKPTHKRVGFFEVDTTRPTMGQAREPTYQSILQQLTRDSIPCPRQVPVAGVCLLAFTATDPQVSVLKSICEYVLRQHLAPKVPCCDLCSPELLNQTRPGPPQAETRASTVRRGIPNQKVMAALNEWRVALKKSDFKRAFWGASGILNDDLIDLLSSIGPIETKEDLERLLKGKWSLLDKYGDSVFKVLTELGPLPPMRPKPKGKSTKRKGKDGGGEVEEEMTVGKEGGKKRNRQEGDNGSGPAAKRSRNVTAAPSTSNSMASQAAITSSTSNQGQVSYPVTLNPPIQPVPQSNATYVQSYGQGISYATHTAQYPAQAMPAPANTYTGPSGQMGYYWYNGRVAHMDSNWAVYYRCPPYVPTSPPGTSAGSPSNIPH